MPKLTKDVTLWMTDELHKRLTEVIMAKENHPRVYWILVKMNDGYQAPAMVRSDGALGGRTKTVDLSGKHVNCNRLVCMEWYHLPPVPLINSSLWRIDNKIGEAKCIYILPPDRPIMMGTEMGESSRFIWKSAKRAPLVFSYN